MAFNREQFAEQFAAAIDALLQSEQVTKRELRDLSRSVLVATHETGDIQYVNRILQVVTPVNRKVCIVFFRHFVGFSFDNKLGMFTKKSKKRYAKALADYVEFIAEPTNNIWTWAERNIEVEQKPMDVEKLGKLAKSIMTRAAEASLTHGDVLRAFIKAGVTADDVIACLDELGFDVKATETQEPPAAPV